jgi:hypothetical protein
MASPKKHTPPSPTAEALGPGIHAGTVELGDGSSYRVKLLTGRRTTATAADGVSPRLLDECLGARRMVMLSDSDRGPVILGALQTAPTPHVDPTSGIFEVDATHIRLRADATITLTSGAASLTLARSGVTRLEGEQMVVDVGALVRFLTAKVELP